MKTNRLFFRFAALLFPLAYVGTFAETTSVLPPSGVMSAALAPGVHPLSFPLQTGNILTGVISGNTPSAITFSSGLIGPALTAGESYYVEIATGPLEGERFDVQTTATIAAASATVVLDLESASLSTLNALPVDVLMGARGVLRRHLKLGKLSSLFSPGLVGHNSATLADGVQLYVNGALRLFYLRADQQTWREPGKTVDERGRLLPPDAGLLLQLRSGAKRWVHAGGVRTNSFRLKLQSGEQAITSGFPLDMSPLQLGAFVDPVLPPEQSWVGGEQPGHADTLKIFDSAAATFKTYFLRADGSTWSKPGTSGNFLSDPVLPAVGMILLKRANADIGYLVLPPVQF